MADYKEKLDDLHRAAKRKAREIDEKLGVKGIVEDTARVAGDAAKLGAKTSRTALSNCAPRPGALLKTTICARRPGAPRMKRSATPKTRANLFAMPQVTPAKSFATPRVQPGRRLEKSSTTRRVTSARRRT